MSLAAVIQQVLCDCKQPASHFQTRKENANKGRWFYTCASRGCKFFQWDDTTTRNAASPGRLSGTEGGSAVAQQKNKVFPNERPQNRPVVAVAGTQQSSRADVIGTGKPPGAALGTVRLAICDDGNIGAASPYNDTLIHAFRSIPGAVWDPGARLWKIPFVQLDPIRRAMKAPNLRGLDFHDLPKFIERVHDQQAKTGIPNEQIEKLMRKRLPKSLMESLLQYQREGVMMAIKKDGRALLGDEMGLGKTIQALSIATYYHEDWPLLVICPSSLRLTWANEINRWLGTGGDNPLSEDDALVLPDDIQVIFAAKEMLRDDAKITIVSYDLFSRAGSSVISGRNFKMVIADESHYLKSPDAKRTKNILPVLKAARRALLLSGTPALSRPIELFTQVSALDPTMFRSQMEYAKRYCDAKQGPFGWDYSGSANLGELNWLLSRTVLIRRLKDQVLNQLPSKIRQTVIVAVDEKVRKKIQKQLSATHSFDEQIDRARESGNTEARRTAQNMKRKALTEMYVETGRAKLEPVKQYLSDLYEEPDKKFIVFAHHKSVLTGIAEHCITKLKAQFIMIDGDTPQKERQALCDRFQNDPKTRIGVLSITAAGVGLTLHAADFVVFAELFWNPAQLLQGEDRAHRIGRKHVVDVKYIISNGTLDDMQWPMIKKKLAILGSAIDGGKGEQMTSIQSPSRKKRKVESDQTTLDAVWEKMKSKAGDEDEIVDDDDPLLLMGGAKSQRDETEDEAEHDEPYSLADATPYPASVPENLKRKYGLIREEAGVSGGRILNEVELGPPPPPSEPDDGDIWFQGQDEKDLELLLVEEQRYMEEQRRQREMLELDEDYARRLQAEEKAPYIL
ncbi:P-loop containing nucleoside triphosphate hydrolase protein [Cladochytrium replicatum]|nr:P-loop containing nucleoside triphosphate hydrolase protein [Cladochytrium replicatum]